MQYLGIDPGASGGLALIDGNGVIVFVGAMPKTDRDLYDALVEARSNAEFDDELLYAVVEHVWSTPGQGGAFKFGMSIGAIRMALVAADIRFDPVLPRAWQKLLGVAYPKGATDTVKKNLTKARAQQLFPGVPITHATADALLLAEYCRRVNARRDLYGEEGEARTGTQQGKGRARAQAPREVRGAGAPPNDGAGPAHQAGPALHVHRRRARAGQPGAH